MAKMRRVRPSKSAPSSFGVCGELELQRPLAGMAEARAAEIVARRRGRAFGLERGVDQRVDALGELGR